MKAFPHNPGDTVTVNSKLVGLVVGVPVDFEGWNCIVGVFFFLHFSGWRTINFHQFLSKLCSRRFGKQTQETMSTLWYFLAVLYRGV